MSTFRYYTIIGIILLSGAVLGQERLPDAGVLLREIERSTGKYEIAPAPLIAPETPPLEAPLPEKPGQKVFVSGFQIQATIFTEEELRTVLKDYTGRELSFNELQEATRKIGDYYRAHDYLAHAYLPPQTVRGGIIEIIVVEGRLGAVNVDPSSNTRLDHNLAIGLVQFRVAPGQFLRPSRLSAAMEILNELPGVRATSTLAPGNSESESVALLKIDDGPLINGSLTLDKGGSRSTGKKRGLFTLAVDDPFGLGEQFAVVGLKTSGTSYLRLGATKPLGFSGLNFGINASTLDYQVGGQFASADLHGSAVTFGITATYPIKRGPGFSLTASATVDHKRMLDWSAAEISSDKRIIVSTFGLSGMVKDNWLGGGTNLLGITASSGRINLAHHAEKFADDQITAGTHGLFTKLSFTATREHPLQDKLTLINNFRSQWSQPNLDGSEQFSLGGQDAIRAYPPSEAGGDRGWLNSIELHWQAQEKLELFGFYDLGRIVLHNRPWNGWQTVADQPNNYLLQGAGCGINWAPLANLRLKAVLAHVIGDNPGRTQEGNENDGTRNDLRSWLQAVFIF